MTVLQNKAINLIDNLNDDNIELLISLINKYMYKSNNNKVINKTTKYEIGKYDGYDWCSPEYDFDEQNEDIAKMFGAL